MLGPRNNTTAARFLIAFSFALVLLAAGAAPFFTANGQKLTGSILYLLLAPVCHQLSARSFAFDGYGLGLCHRCCGLYLGIVVAAIFTTGRWLESKPAAYRQAWAIGATALLASDALLPYVSLWTNTRLTRFTSGFVFGAMLGSLLVPALAQLLARWQNRRRTSLLPDTQGDLT